MKITSGTAVSFKRVSPFRNSYSPAVLEYIELFLGIRLPRPSYATTEWLSERVPPLPDATDYTRPFLEGAMGQVTRNEYERDAQAKQKCIALHGTACVVCGFSFGSVYGAVVEGYIHVHHLHPFGEIGGEYEVDPVEDLRPVCPNCHAVIHSQMPAYSIEEVRMFIENKSHA